MHAETQRKYGFLDEIGTLSQPRGGLLHKKKLRKNIAFVREPVKNVLADFAR